MSLALEGIKVVDVSRVVAVPAAAQHLGDFGAEVIHVEAPLAGDSWRYFLSAVAVAGGTSAPVSEISYQFDAFNRNKRSLSLDLSQDEGQAVIYKLLEDADVFLTNMRPFAQERFRIDYETLHERFPRLIHGSLSGQGKKGPERNLPAYDATAYWFRGGAQHALSEEAVGTVGCRPAFGDSIAGMSLFAGIMTALFARERTGMGQQVDLSLFNLGVYQLSFDIAGFLATGTDFREMEAKADEDRGDTELVQLRARLQADTEEFVERRRESMGGAPLMTVFRTSDSRRFNSIPPAADVYFQKYCRIVGREDLFDDPRFASHELRVENFMDLYRIIRDAFLTKTLDEWRPILNREEIAWAPEQTFREIVNDPQARANDFFVPFDHPIHGRVEVIANPLKLSETPSTIRLPAPEFSQHTEEILLEMGYSWEDIAGFKERGVIA